MLSNLSYIIPNSEDPTVEANADTRTIGTIAPSSPPSEQTGLAVMTKNTLQAHSVTSTRSPSTLRVPQCSNATIKRMLFSILYRREQPEYGLEKEPPPSIQTCTILFIDLRSRWRTVLDENASRRFVRASALDKKNPSFSAPAPAHAPAPPSLWIVDFEPDPRVPLIPREVLPQLSQPVVLMIDVHKLPFIIAKELDVEEKSRSRKSAESPQASSRLENFLSDIQGINPEFLPTRFLRKKTMHSGPTPKEDKIQKSTMRCEHGNEALEILSVAQWTQQGHHGGKPHTKKESLTQNCDSCNKSREKHHNVMEMPQNPSKFVKSLDMWGHRLYGPVPSSLGNNIFSWQSTICQNGLKRKRSPTNDAQ
ncbi:hypothetical protein Tco_0587580 [Tanacetum coccineum]